MNIFRLGRDGQYSQREYWWRYLAMWVMLGSLILSLMLVTSIGIGIPRIVAVPFLFYIFLHAWYTASGRFRALGYSGFRAQLLGLLVVLFLNSVTFGVGSLLLGLYRDRTTEE